MRPSYMDDINTQSRAGISLTHRFSERLRFSSRNFISYELEPDYSYGYASSRQTGAYFFWQTDNSLGFRWTERFATYTGVRLSGTKYADICQQRPVHLGTLQPVPLSTESADGSDGGLPLFPDLGERSIHRHFRPILPGGFGAPLQPEHHRYCPRRRPVS